MPRSLVARRTLLSILLGALLLATPALVSISGAQEPTSVTAVRVSEVGRYEGYSEPRYDGWERDSLYVPMRDGVRLAVDVLRPTAAGEVATEPLPAVWTYNRYHRATLREGQVQTVADIFPDLADLLRHGYVVVSVDARGAGASFGVSRGLFAPVEARDGFDLTEWIAAQPWCDGKVGMYGGSYLGITQYLAAGTTPPHLEAIFPTMAGIDLYSIAYTGGISRRDLFEKWAALVKRLDTEVPAPPVDADPRGELAREAREVHRANRSALDLFSGLPLRDSQDRDWRWPYFVMSPFSWIDGIRESGVAVYHLSGWWDVFGRDALLWYEALAGSNPQKMIVGPWSHNQTHGLDYSAELRRWFDHWLKGVDNGIMDEPPIHYRPLGAADDDPWLGLEEWPPTHDRATTWFFRGGDSGTVASVNDGVLNPDASGASQTDENAADVYTMDYSATSGKPSRYSNAYGDGGVEFSYPDMTSMDEKGLTYTSPPLATDLEVTGHPIAHLWVTSTAEDGDFFVYLEEVDGEGVSHYVTEGALRASHRKLGESSYPVFGLPYHRSMEIDLRPLEPGVPAELVLDLYPVSNVFDRGNRIRVTITGADQANHATPILDPPPRVELLRNRAHPSRIVLPVIPRGPKSQ